MRDVDVYEYPFFLGRPDVESKKSSHGKKQRKTWRSV